MQPGRELGLVRERRVDQRARGREDLAVDQPRGHVDEVHLLERTGLGRAPLEVRLQVLAQPLRIDVLQDLGEELRDTLRCAVLRARLGLGAARARTSPAVVPTMPAISASASRPVAITAPRWRRTNFRAR